MRISSAHKKHLRALSKSRNSVNLQKFGNVSFNANFVLGLTSFFARTIALPERDENTEYPSQSTT